MGSIEIQRLGAIVTRYHSYTTIFPTFARGNESNHWMQLWHGTTVAPQFFPLLQMDPQVIQVLNINFERQVLQIKSNSLVSGY